MSMWDYRDTTWTSGGTELVGYDVEATDGSIGKIDEATNEAGGSYVVVDTGFWIFGKKRLIPAGAISGVNHDDKQVSVNMTKDEIKSAPDFDKDTWNDESRVTYDEYYTPFGRDR